MKKLLEVFFIFLRLGCTSFGGPIAHLGYFQDEFVNRRKWLDEKSYLGVVSLCQFLPGPASSQVGMVIGNLRAGFLGSIFAWLGFTMPSAILMILFGLGVTNFPEQISPNFLHGCKLAAVAVVAQAVWQMGSKLCSDRERIGIAVASAILISFFSGALGQIVVILFGALIGNFFLRSVEIKPDHPSLNKHNSRFAFLYLILFFSALLFFPIAVKFFNLDSIRLFDSFYRVGSLVFGGGHVVLPLLKEEVVSTGWVSNESFLAGYGIAQAIPGPLFTFAAYLGTVSLLYPNGWLGGIFCLVAVFLPSFLLVLGVFPFWEKFKRYKSMQNVMNGINAAVVGLLLAAFYNPVWTSAILSSKDFSVALLLFLLLVFWKFPSWSIVILSAALEFYIN